jgi:hypothetical protein
MRERKRHILISDKEARNSIFPRTKSERNQLLGIVGFVFGVILAVVGLFHIKQRSQLVRDQTWARSIGTIVDARTHLISESSGLYGGSMSYDVQVLVAFSANGSQRESWITVGQPPKTLASAEVEQAHWKGTQCVVRWNPSNLSAIAVEVRGFPELR